MAHPIYSQLIRFNQWGDRSLCDVLADNLQRLNESDATIVLRVLDHIHVVGRIFQHHLQGVPHAFAAPRSDDVPDLQTVAAGLREVDDWYVSYVSDTQDSFDQPLDFAFTNGSPARMTRGEMLLHVCMHSAGHRGNVGIVLQKSGITPNKDRVTDFLEAARN
jgi:uncharacterized damage-inducible protein DinB